MFADCLIKDTNSIILQRKFSFQKSNNCTRSFTSYGISFKNEAFSTFRTVSVEDSIFVTRAMIFMKLKCND